MKLKCFETEIEKWKFSRIPDNYRETRFYNRIIRQRGGGGRLPRWLHPLGIKIDYTWKADDLEEDLDEAEYDDIDIPDNKHNMFNIKICVKKFRIHQLYVSLLQPSKGVLFIIKNCLELFFPTYVFFWVSNQTWGPVCEIFSTNVNLSANDKKKGRVIKHFLFYLLVETRGVHFDISSKMQDFTRPIICLLKTQS